MSILDPSDPIGRQIVAATETQETATITIPIELLRQAQVAMSEYGDYGSNDDEHEVLLALADSVTSAISDPGYEHWQVTIATPHPPKNLLDRIANRVPEDLADSLVLIGTTVTGTIRDEALGVAQAAGYQLLAAVTRLDQTAQLLSIKQIG